MKNEVNKTLLKVHLLNDLFDIVLCIRQYGLHQLLTTIIMINIMVDNNMNCDLNVVITADLC